jgi:Rrf2 family protein
VTNTRFAVAVHVLTLLAQAPRSSETMAGSVGTNPVHVRRVLGPLRRAGLVGSRPGSGGGWHLERAAEQITLGDVWRALHEADSLLPLHEGANPDCEVGRNIQGTLERVGGRAARAVAAELDTITIADVLRDTVPVTSPERRRRPSPSSSRTAS